VSTPAIRRRQSILPATVILSFAAIAWFGTVVWARDIVGIEKQWVHGEGFAKVVGIAALALAVAVIFFPGLAPGLRSGAMASMATMGS